ncbi:MAG: hypothetical protein LBK55_06630 [Azoarcus sp.]|jgi:hypothetical protein|nr:hypothetical protein [Azoarcus sp.]
MSFQSALTAQHPGRQVADGRKAELFRCGPEFSPIVLPVVLLTRGNKSTQKKDIETALKMAQELGD